jgi:hypothetical protein
MKNLILQIFLALTISITIKAQTVTVEEPEFINTSVFVKNNTSIKLEKAIPHEYSRPTAGSILVGGYGRVRFNQVKGSASSVKIQNDEKLTFIVRAYTNEIDPVDAIAIIKLEVTGSNRKYRVMQDDLFGQSKSADIQYISYEAKKYGKSSYMIVLNQKPEPGEYAICFRHASDVLNCFGVE